MNNLEIERKFLVSIDALNSEDIVNSYRIRQGYLNKNESGSVRVRIVEDGADTVAYLMSKTRIDEMSNDERTDSISVAHAEHLLLNFCIKTIDKKRFCIMYKGRLWEVDLFESPRKGLIMAEIELTSRDQQFELPPWVIREVTGLDEYYNANM